MNTSHLPRQLFKLKNTRVDSTEYISVKQLEVDGALFVQDGNHGNNRPRQDEFVDTGIPFVRPPDLVDGQVNFDSCGRLNDKFISRVKKGIGRRGDILLTTNATIGRKAIIRNDSPEPL